MNWLILVLAGLFEIGWAIGLKYTEGFTRLWPTVGTVLAMIISLGLLGIAMKSLPVGTAYAVWVGVGAVGTAILGIAIGRAQSELQSLMRISYAVFCLKKKNKNTTRYSNMLTTKHQITAHDSTST